MSDFPFPSASAEAAGFDPERLARIAPAMQRYIDDGKVPNLVTLVARGGRLVHLDARGLLDIDEGGDVGADTLFRMFSNTKPIAGVATMLLYEAGELTPDDPIGRYLPEFRNLQVRLPGGLTERARRGVTIRDCLTNTTGLATPYGFPIGLRAQYRDAIEVLGWDRGGASPAGVEERVAALASLPLNFHPGSAFEYHVGYLPLGAVIEKITGQSLEAFFRERIFDPLGMADTGFYLREDQHDRFGSCYVPRETSGEWRLARTETGAESEKRTGPPTFFAAGGDRGGVVSTIGDYARFGQMLLNGGELDGVRILGRKTVALMTANHTPGMMIDMVGPGSGWGLGVSVYTGTAGMPLLRSVGSYGWGGAAGTTYLADPEEQLLMACFTQVMQHRMMPGNEYQLDFQRLVYQALR